MFGEVVHLDANTWYTVKCKIFGSVSDCGKEGLDTVTTEDGLVSYVYRKILNAKFVRLAICK